MRPGSSRVFWFGLALFACVATAPLAGQEPHPHGDLRVPCEDCHSAEAWTPLRSELGFEHATTGFALHGAHGEAKCSDCHASLEFTRVATACADCHADAHEGELGAECETCHTPHDWDNRQRLFESHGQTLFALLGTHATQDCSSCHAGQRQSEFAATPTDCIGCHLEDYQATTDPDHAAALFPTDCVLCHAPQAPTWQAATFDHDVAFPLIGAHRRVGCADCHAGAYAGTPTECSACHRDDYASADDPDHEAAGFPLDCTICHSNDTWASGEFDHAATRFALTGAHVDAQCASCHAERFQGTTTECFGCHEADYRGTRTPDHAAANFPRACEQCHVTSTWATEEFDHDTTGFALTGAHVDAECASCHANGYAGTPAECFACHEADYRGTADPDHETAGFPRQCEECHRTRDWRSQFDHGATAFALTGAHRDAECASCHAQGYAGTSTECFACHESDYRGTRDPNHQAAGYPTDCAQCHRTNSWASSTFDHDATRFALTGAHVDAECSSCHAQGYAGTPIECFACHESDYRGTRDPNHAAAGFSRTCQECHGTTSWSTDDFDHDSTGFTLTGAHRDAECSSCHAQGYAGTTTDCYACHQSDFTGATDPDHRQFPHACADCHSTSGWSGADFDHAETGFALTGAHRDAECASCHAQGYAGTSTDCYACHRSDYTGTADPNHQTAGFPTTCAQCHSTSGWSGAQFDHNTTAFALTGAHRDAQCASCHAQGYAGTSTDCYACHRSDYTGTTDPNHQTAGFPTTCAQCHSTSGWSGAQFDHNTTGFALTGAHRDAQCASCHAQGYSGTPTDCYACHQSDYTATRDPNHQAAGFPTTCQSCHGTNGWEGAEFDHNQFFPITSGAHDGLSCSSCHVSQSNYSFFECINCHEHERTQTDRDHDEVGGYLYESASCYRCHPDGDS